MNNFWLRAITGVVFVGLLVSSIISGGILLYAVLGTFAILGQSEFYPLFKKSPYSPNLFGIIIGGILISSCLANASYQIFIAIGTLLLSFGVVAVCELFRKKQLPFQNIALTLAGIVYVILPFYLLILLPQQTNSSYDYRILLALFIMVWCNDTFAYLIGRSIGKHKLFERISPKKTWEGFIGGLIFCIGAAVLLAYFYSLDYFKSVSYGVITGIAGTAGDLVQSLLKRSLNVKDSGKILPGHGGILDRFDGIIFVTPIIFFLEKFIF